MLLPYHLYGLTYVFCMENVPQIVQEICGINTELAVEDLLVLVDILYFNHFPHQIVTIIDNLGLYLSKLLFLFHILLNLDDSLSVSVFLLLLLRSLSSVPLILCGSILLF